MAIPLPVTEMHRWHILGDIGMCAAAPNCYTKHTCRSFYISDKQRSTEQLGSQGNTAKAYRTNENTYNTFPPRLSVWHRTTAPV